MDQGTLIFVGTVLGIYFLPAIIARAKGHHNASAIAALNLFLGWTILGWIGAFVWALTNPPRVIA